MTLIEQLTAEASEAIKELDVALATLSEPLTRGLIPTWRRWSPVLPLRSLGRVNLLDAVRDAKWFGDIHEMSRGEVA